MLTPFLEKYITKTPHFHQGESYFLCLVFLIINFNN